MAGRLSFSIAINLLTENFKKGTSTVKNGFRSMQAQVLTFAAALGFAGVSLSNLVSEIIRVARETGKAVTALKNVSGSTAQFADNLRFTTALAKKYGAYVNDITGNFAKFTAAASIAGMSMDDQRKIFESLSRAAAGFGLSADETNGMFLAVTQMMGKGKIQAEELRGQLGERLPIAMQAMAKAAGTTVAGLDDIMKKGKLLSAEVLPGFAKALDEIIPNVDTDNIETSLNRLKNTFQEITNSAGVQAKYKALIDGLNSLLQGFAGQMKNVFVGVIAAIAFAGTRGLTKFWGSLSTTQEGILKDHERCQTQALLATEKRQLAELNLERANAAYIKATDNEILAAKAEKKKAEIALKAATTRETKALAAQEAAAAKMAAMQSQGFFSATKNLVITGAARVKQALISMWSAFGPAVVLAVITGVVAKLVEIRKEAKRINNIFSDYKKNTLSIPGIAEAENLRQLYRIASNINEKYDVRKRALDQINEKLGTSFGIDAKNLALQKDINKVVNDRIKLIEAQAAAEYYMPQKIEAQDKINGIYKQYGNGDLQEGQKQLDKLGKFYMRNYSPAWGIFGEPQALKDYRSVVQYQDVRNDADANIQKYLRVGLPTGTNTASADLSTDKKNKSPLEKAEESYAQKIRELEARREIEKMSISQYSKALDDLNKSALIEAKASGDKQILESQYCKNLQSAVANLNYTEEQKAQDKFLAVKNEYTEASAKLKNQLENGVIDQKRYNEELASLADTTVLTAGALSGIGEAGKEFIAALQKTASDARSVTLPQYKDRDKTFDYKKTDLEKLQADRDNRLDYVDKLKGQIGGNADEIEEKLKAARGNLEAIKKEYGSVATELIQELNNALGNVTTLDQALKIAEVKQDIKSLTKELNQGMYSGMKDIASNADRLVSAFSNLSEVMSDEDATAWERILAVWNAMTNTVDAFLSVISMIENLTEITKKLGEAKQKEVELDSEKAAVSMTNAAATSAEASANVALASSIELLKKVKDEQATADEVNTQKEVANNAIRVASDKMAAVTGMGLDEMAADKKVETATKEVAANTAAGASEAGKGAAKLPFPYNIIAIGGAIAAAIAAFAMIPKFASGGIIQGSTSGDRNLARVNGGEMILNGRQQATLFQLANGRGIRTNSEGGKVEFEIRYDRLVGVLDNGNKKQGRGR